MSHTQKIVSIIVASNRPHHMRAFLENLQQTITHPTAIEVLIKIDVGDFYMGQLMEQALKTFSFPIHYIQTPKLDGYYTLHFAYQQLFEMSDKETYFIFPVNEEVRFKTQGWDEKLAQYIKFFPDDLFRLKISRLKFRNYYYHYDCGPTPENYPFLTRKWVELAEGIGDCWGPDGWHQYIDYHLGQTKGVANIPGLFRSVPIHDILISGEEAGKELSKDQVKKRTLRICQEWWRMYNVPSQQKFRRLAEKMAAYVWAKHEQIEDFEIIENKKSKYFQVKGKIKGKQKLSKMRFFYHLSPAYIQFVNFCFLIKMARRHSIGFLKAYLYPSYGPTHGILKYLDRTKRVLFVGVAIFLSFFISQNESIPKQWWRRIYIRTRTILGLLKRVLVSRFFKIEAK